MSVGAEAAKEIALGLLKFAAAMYEPLARFLGNAVDSAPSEHQSTAAEVRAILPEEGASAAARRELEAEAEAAAHREG